MPEEETQSGDHSVLGVKLLCASSENALLMQTLVGPTFRPGLKVWTNTLNII